MRLTGYDSGGYAYHELPNVGNRPCRMVWVDKAHAHGKIKERVCAGSRESFTISPGKGSIVS